LKEASVDLGFIYADVLILDYNFLVLIVCGNLKVFLVQLWALEPWWQRLPSLFPILPQSHKYTKDHQDF